MTNPTISPTSPKWEIADPIPSDISETLHEYHPVLRQLLYNRGITTSHKAREFLNPSLDSAYDPFKLKGMEEAVDRILFALNHNEKIAIYGDYDADGVTATALLFHYLNQLGAEVTYHIPNRFEEGYGVRKDGLDLLKEQGVKLVITVDCGVRSTPEADHAHAIGLDLIITDHHQPSPDLPIAKAIIDPKQPDDIYPFKELTGVGLAYKLAQAIESRMFSDVPPVSSYLDLVSLGTIADMAPLVEENRLLTFMGMRQIMQNSRLGIKALIGTAGFSPDALNAQHISHMIAPRLNAAGRLESALSALSLLLTKDPSEASLKAQELDNQNRLRQQLTHQLEQIALQIAFQEDESPLLLFAVHKEFNLGVIGLVASHLTEKYYRPSIVAVETEDFIRASCRSIPEFNITAALDQCADLMEHHGGHASAAGFTIRKDRFIELKHRLQEIAQAELANRELQPVYKADMELDLSAGISFFNNLQDLQPTGIGNPTPTFITRNVFPHDVKLVGKDQSHLKFRINSAWHCIAFRKGHLIDNLRTNIDILYTIEKQDYNGNTYLQLNIRDIRPSN